MPIKITQWAFTKRVIDDPFCPPECSEILSLCGHVEDHPHYPRLSGKDIKTSELVGGSGCLVRTASGSEYLLVGPPIQEYLDWLEEKGFEFDEENPLRSYAEQWFGESKGGLEV